MTELAELLTGPTARHALACRDIAEVYRILRDAGISQASIAVATQQRESAVSEILAGRRVQSVAVLERIANGLGVPRGGMGLAYTPDVAPIHQEIQIEGTSDDNLLRHAAMVLCGSPVATVREPIRQRLLIALADAHRAAGAAAYGAGLRDLARQQGLRSVSVLARLAPLQEAAAARRDSACQDLASELATLRSAA